MAVTTIGLDIAKHVFQGHGVDGNGRTTLTRRLRRDQVAEFFANVPTCVIGIEATQGAHHWARVLGRLGHDVKLISPQFVKPTSSHRRTMRRTQRRSAKRPRDRTCDSCPLRPSNSRISRCCTASGAG
jgi:transposase